MAQKFGSALVLKFNELKNNAETKYREYKYGKEKTDKDNSGSTKEMALNDGFFMDQNLDGGVNSNNNYTQEKQQLEII